MRYLMAAGLLIVMMAGSCRNQPKQPAPLNDKSQAIGCAAPATNDKAWYASGKKAPKLNGLTGIDFKITTVSSEAREYFNQGMMLAYGFNHAEAARSFFEAARLDSTCAMAYWGFAYVLGPNYNGGMEEDNFQRAWDAAQQAIKLAANSTPTEKALVAAMGTRYAENPPADRKTLDIAYANAMKKVYQQFPSDPDVGALYAESLMDLHPWDLYEKKNKTPKAWTPELVKLLEGLMKRHPTHPGAHHFYIHAMEASAVPEKALASARLLDSLVPGAGHLIHMPSHIYINTGDYHLGSLSNIQAVKVDSIYTTTCHAQGSYPLALYPHNYHFLAATATLEGNSKLAWESAKKVQEHTSSQVMEMPGWSTLQHYYTIPWYVGVKLSMWDSIIAIPKPKNTLVYPTAIWHYAKGMAWLGKSNLKNAEAELGSLRIAAMDSSLKDLTIWGINSSADLVAIAIRILSAGIASHKNETGQTISLLKEAVAIEDELNYNEPPDWFFSVRHHLGAALLKAGRYNEAEKIYREDLKTWKRNGWALSGLYQSLLKQDKQKEAAAVKVELTNAWQYADFTLSNSSDIFSK